jgi:hypothetical protein
MRFTTISKVYIGVLIVLMGGFVYAGTRGFRVLSMAGSSKWHHEYTPGVHMLRHK